MPSKVVIHIDAYHHIYAKSVGSHIVHLNILDNHLFTLQEKSVSV